MEAHSRFREYHGFIVCSQYTNTNIVRAGRTIPSKPLVNTASAAIVYAVKRHIRFSLFSLNKYKEIINALKNKVNNISKKIILEKTITPIDDDHTSKVNTASDLRF